MADSMFPAPVNPDDPGRGPLIMGLIWTWSALALIVVGVRFWIRIAVMKFLVLEDWLMLAAVTLNTVCVSCLTVAIHHGFGMHDADLTFDQVVNISKWVSMSFTPGVVCSIAARISIAILLIRIFGNKAWLKWFLIAITILQVAPAVILIFTFWLQIRPVEGLWNPLIQAERWNPNIVNHIGIVAGCKSQSRSLQVAVHHLSSILTVLLLGAFYALGDLCYVLVPVLIVWKLNMPFHRKLGLCILLALSLFTMGASIAKAVTAANGDKVRGDGQYIASMSLMWSTTEQTFVIMMGCAPPLSSIAKLKLPSVLSISASFRRLVSSRSTGYELEDSNGLGRSSDRIHTSEMGLKRSSSGRGPSRDHEVYQI